MNQALNKLQRMICREINPNYPNTRNDKDMVTFGYLYVYIAHTRTPL